LRPVVEPTASQAPALATKPTVVLTPTVAVARVPGAVPNAGGAAASPAAGTPSPVPNAAATAEHTPIVTPSPVPNAAASPASVPPTPSGVPTAALAQSGRAGSVALTFDAGADRGYAEDILDALHDEHVVASFGITGQWAKANQDLVRRMAAEGHQVFNHTLDHRSFTGASDRLGGLSAARRRAELEDAEAIIAPLIGHTTRPFYRLPYGDDDARVAADVQPAGFTRKVGWTIDSLGWRGAPAGDIVARCLKLVTPGAIYVFHVGRASQDAIALPEIIHELRDAGFSFHRVDQS
jgi:peptidoglycan-N-acetylglucosamine deacetylase